MKYIIIGNIKGLGKIIYLKWEVVNNGSCDSLNTKVRAVKKFSGLSTIYKLTSFTIICVECGCRVMESMINVPISSLSFR